MKRNTKGFTLVELLVTIVLLGVVATIVIVNMTSISKNSKDREYEAFRSKVLSAATAYGAQNSDVFANLYVDKAYMYITTGDVISAGYLDENLINPYTKERIGKEELIKAVLDTSSGALKFDYPSENKETEQFLVALDDYVIFGEPYDCMNGLGSYKLALSDENGNMITDPEKILNDYHFTCSYDSSWQEWDDAKYAQSHNGVRVLEGETVRGKDGKVYYAPEAGTYKIKYQFVSDAGILKEFERNITVLETFEPGFEVKKIVKAVNPSSGNIPAISASDFNSSTETYTTTVANNVRTEYAKYVPEITDKSSACGTYKFLAFRPTLIGADASNSQYWITRTNNKASGAYKTTTNAITENLTPVAGSKDFNTVYTVRDGDNIYNIKAQTVGHYYKKYILKSEQNIEINQGIVLDSCKIKGQSTIPNSERTLQIVDTYSTQGIKEYQSQLVPMGKTDQPGIDTFNRVGVTTPKYFTAIGSSGSCTPHDNYFDKVRIRAVNNEGYYGEWATVDVKISNRLFDILESQRVAKGAGCANTCENSGAYSTSLRQSVSCRYCSRNRAISYKGRTYYVLGKTNDSTIITDDGAVGASCSVVSWASGSWGTQTCDGYYSTSYSYSYTNWYCLKNSVDRIKVNVCSSDNIWKSQAWGTESYGTFNGITGLATSSDANIFGAGLPAGFIVPYQGSSSFSVCVHGSWCTSRANYYMYYINGNRGLSPIYGSGSVRLMHLANKDNTYVCSGAGSTGSPYVIATRC